MARPFAFARPLPRRVVPDRGLPRPLAWSAAAVRLTLGGLFLWASALKLSHPRAFAHVVDRYGIVPDGWPLVIAAFAIPSLEALAGLGVFIGRREGYGLMLGMLALFIGMLSYGILRDLDVDCGCFSLEERRGQASLKAAFARDWAMAAGVAWCLFVNNRGAKSPMPATNNREDQQ